MVPRVDECYSGCRLSHPEPLVLYSSSQKNGNVVDTRPPAFSVSLARWLVVHGERNLFRICGFTWADFGRTNSSQRHRLLFTEVM
jgi:hypothetical protein